jgi:hypothetical protein
MAFVSDSFGSSTWTVFESDEEAEARRLCLSLEAYRERQARYAAEVKAAEAQRLKESAERNAYISEQYRREAEKPNAVRRINAALRTLQEEGCAVDAKLQSLFLTRKGEISKIGYCKVAGMVELERKALNLHLKYQCDVALADEVASILGLLAD